MLVRRLLLLDPTGDSGGGAGTQTPAPATPAPATTAAPAGEAAGASGTGTAPASGTSPTPVPGVMLTVEQYNELLQARDRDRAAQTERDRLAQEARDAQMERARQSGDAEAALRLQDQNHRQELESERNARLIAENQVIVERRATNEATARMAVSAALATRTFLSDVARDQAAALLLAHVEGVREGDVVHVRQRGTGTPAAEFLNRALEGPEYAHFLSARNRGGSDNTGGQRPPGSGTHPNPLMAALFENQSQVREVRTGEAIGLSGRRN